METVRFIHAADVHLDAVFRGLAQDVPGELAVRLHGATFGALQRLFALCEREHPDFVVLAGDLYNQEDRSVRAQLRVREGCARLETLGVRVFIAHGNHDPYPSRFRHLQWPSNVTVFGEEVESHPVLRDGKIIAVVHGVSHASVRETRNLAAQFQRSQETCLQVGVLHTTLGEADGEARYAPCCIEDLVASGMDYWALGHVHERRELCQKPLAMYPGSLQGQHINEQGDRGCLVVTATDHGELGRAAGEYTLDATFRPVGSVIWQVLDVSLDEVGVLHKNDAATTVADPAPSAMTEITLDVVESRLRQALDEAVSRLGSHAEVLIARIRLSGRTGLDASLRSTPFLADLLERLREAPVTGPLVWVKDIQVHTRPLIERATLMARDDLLGEIVRMGDTCRSDATMLDEVVHNALGDLFDHARARKVLERLTAAEQMELLDSAESLCVDLLENN